MAEKMKAQPTPKKIGREGYRKIDTHPQKKQIVADLLKQVPYRDISRKYGISVDAIRRWQKEQIQKSIKKNPQGFGTSAKEQLDWIDSECKKIIAACKRELGDPDDPDEYDFSPSSEEVDVQYVKIAGNIKTQPRKESIADILSRMENAGYLPMKIYYQKTDSRRILLEALKLAKSNIETIAKLTGELSEITINQQMNAQVNIDLSGVVIPKIMDAIRQSTKEHPEVGIKITDAIYEIVEAAKNE